MTSTDTTAAAAGEYTFDSASTEGATQVRLLADILDGHSIAVLEQLDLAPDSTCLDLGAGAGSIAAWLADQGAPQGHVTAVDQTTVRIPAHERITAVDADITTHKFGTERFDLIHARLLFMHLTEREQVLARAVTALKPGGFLVVSDWDCTHLDEMIVAASDEVADAFTAFQHALISFGTSNGMDPAWARRIPAAMADAGLRGITTSVFNKLWAGGEAGMLLHASNSRQLEAGLLGHGVTREQLDTLRTAMTNPQVWAYHWPMYTAVGVRPTH
ncbi:class I SAM-dependent methyltransferase [Actinoplanes rectilineatus]|uniref:class I SAM-dependent methyltransferase n=1 Tax=Actinoplanes rectilineatus TaxID=113571 RepID=UPI0005F27D03|nr:class I SAM-dependent methyltransferase [Actinoplanes rectilineatus]